MKMVTAFVGNLSEYPGSGLIVQLSLSGGNNLQLGVRQDLL